MCANATDDSESEEGEGETYTNITANKICEGHERQTTDKSNIYVDEDGRLCKDGKLGITVMQEKGSEGHR